jgi:predicted thioesterase
MITTGIKGHLQRIVTPELTAAHVGSGLANVFATPMMVALIEETCCQSVAPFLQEGKSTVGTLVNVAHTAPTPVGMQVWCDSTLVEVDRRRLVFEVKAYDQHGLIGHGQHERFIINFEQFQAKADAKAH